MVESLGRAQRPLHVVSAQIEIQVAVREPVAHLMRPMRRERRLSDATDPGDHLRRRGLLVRRVEPDVQPPDVVLPVDEMLDVGGQLPGNRYFGPIDMVMEVHAARDVPGLHDIGGGTG